MPTETCVMCTVQTENLVCELIKCTWQTERMIFKLMFTLVFMVLHGGCHTTITSLDRPPPFPPCRSVQQQLSVSTKLMKTQWHLIWNITRVRRVKDGGGLAVKAKQEKHLTSCGWLDATENLISWFSEELVSSPVACSSYLPALFSFHYFHRWCENIQNWSAVNKCCEEMFCSVNAFLTINSG